MDRKSPAIRTRESTRKVVPLWRVADVLANKNGLRRTVYDTNGDEYLGSWQNNQRHGRGRLKYRDGAKYEGDWHCGLRHGLGTLHKLVRGRYQVQYTGEWEHNVPHGKGKLYQSEKGMYTGNWLHGKRNGQGQMQYLNGATYDGHWHDDMRHGPGTMVYASGAVYEGEWAADVRCGHGSWVNPNRGLKFEGLWSQDKAVQGTYIDIAIKPFSEMLPVLEVTYPGDCFQQT